MFFILPRNFWLGCLWAFTCVLLLATSSSAHHPFHVATAETRWNLETKKLEVSIRCHPIDLETALRRRTGKKIDLDTTENVDQLLTEYLRETFQLHQGPLPAPAPGPTPEAALSTPNVSTDASAKETQTDAPSAAATATSNAAAKTTDAKLAKLHWVGKEIDMKWAWLYLELEPADMQQELHMTNTILMDVLDDQSNTVIIRLGSQRQSLMFHQKKRTLPFPRPSDFAKQPE